MKPNTKIALALSAILAVGAQSAAAAPTADNTLYISGATAVDRTLFEAIVDPAGICESTGIVVYTFGTTSSATTPSSYGNFLVHCTGRATTTLAGTEIGISKSSVGSEYGIDPVANGTSTLTLNGSTVDVNFTTTSCAGNVSVPAASGRSAYTMHYGCTQSTGQVPQAGVSDVEPALFGASTTLKNRLLANGAATVPFTMFVSKNFYRALQTAQGLAGNTLVGGSGASTTCGTDTALLQTDACTPSLSMATVRAILAGQVSTVSGLYNGSTALTAPAGGNSLLICRRANSSGSQKSVERLFFNQNCKATPAQTFVTDSTVVNGSGQACLDVGCTWANTVAGVGGQSPVGAGGVAENFIFQGTATGDVESCMNWATGGFVGGSDGVYAVGIASGDRTPNDTASTTGKQFRYIKIDGVLPSVDNVVSGKWQYTTENVVLTPTSIQGNVNYSNYNTGLRPAITTAILSQLRVPANLVKSQSGLYATGKIGLAARPSSTQAPAAGDTAAVRPLAPFIRAADRSSNPPVNNCNENLISLGSPVKVN
jgi:hypothetical protein